MVTDRMIVIAQNKDFPRLRDLVVCPDCGGTGHDYEYYNCPIEQITRHRKVPCGTCNGEGAYERPAVKGASVPLAGVSVLSTGRDASIYDATAERWIRRSSGMMPDAGAAADLRHSTLVGTSTHVLRKCSHPKASEAPAVTPAPQSSPRGTSLLEQVQDVVTFVTACVVFGGLAMFFLILA